jgi:hypothetical protein
VALAEIEAALPRLLARATRVLARFRVMVDWPTPDALLHEAVADVLEKKSGSVDPVAYCWKRMEQLAANSVRKRVRRERMENDARAAVHPSADQLDLDVAPSDVAARVMEALTTAACDDEEVFKLLAGFVAVADRDDVDDVRKKRRFVLESSGLDAATYQRALRRLDTLVRSLPDDLRQDALAALGEEP